MAWQVPLLQKLRAAGVPIEADFVLSRVLHNGEQDIVPDGREIDIKDDEAFWAIPGDDNS